MSWKLRWRDTRDPYRIKSIASDTLSYPDGRFQAFAKQFAEIAKVMDAKLLNNFDKTFSDRFTEISFAQPPPIIQGEVPLDDIASGLGKGTVIPFLGAGVPLSGRADDDVERYGPRGPLPTPGKSFVARRVRTAMALEAP